jgi:MoxR-like ATPase
MTTTPLAPTPAAGTTPATTTIHAHTLTLPWVDAATSRYVFVDELRAALSLAAVSGLGLLLSGEGGHAKSDFLRDALGAIQTGMYVKSFGQGTSTEELFGGLDFDALRRDTDARMQFQPELSFLNYTVAVFEELFDAPPRVLTYLKDTLTAGKLRNGHQQFVMRTRILCAATNRSPQDIAKLGPEVEALIQRFPIQLDVRWPNYDEGDFVQMFGAVLEHQDGNSPDITWDEIEAMQERAAKAVVSKSIQRLLARICAELRRDRVPMSPRTAMMAVRLAQAAAVINGRDQVVADDLIVTSYLPGAHAFKQRVREMIAENKLEIDAEMALDELEERYQAACAAMQNMDATTVLVLNQVLDELNATTRETAEIRTGTTQAGRRRRLLDDLRQMITQVTTTIENLDAKTRVDVHRARLEQISIRLKEIDRLFRNGPTSAERSCLLLEAMGYRDEIGRIRVHDDTRQLADAVSSKVQILLMRH